MELHVRVLVSQLRVRVTLTTLMTGFRRAIAKYPGYQFVGPEAVLGQMLSEMRQVRRDQSDGDAGEPPVRLVFGEDVGQVLGRRSGKRCAWCYCKCATASARGSAVVRW